MRRPRLLVIGPTPPPVHGTAVYTRMLLESERLSDAFDVCHLDIADRRTIENLGRLDPTNVWLGLKHLTQLAVRMVRHRPDVVYIEVSQNALAYVRDACFMALARAGGARVVTHLHGGYFGTFYGEASAPVRALIRRSSRWVERAWVLGDGLRHHYDGLVPPADVRVVANGVPGPAAGPPDRGARSGPPTVLFLGQLSVAKGVVDLLDALERIEDLPWRLVLAGGWLSHGDEAAVRARLEGSAIARRVSLPGVVTGDAKERLLAEADLFVLPTRYPYEGQPLTILEAMAAALPAISTPRGAIPDMVEDGRTGRLVPEGDAGALEAALRSLLADGPLRVSMGAEARRLWEDRFTAGACIARFVEEVEDLLAPSVRERQAGEEALA